MGGYPVFSAPGPTVDVRLFGEAAQQGAQLGQEIPNPVTSAITGAEAGIKYGQDFTREQAQISNEQAVAKINQLNAEKQAATQTADIQATQAKLTDETAVATQDANLQTQENQFYDLMQKSSPQERAQAVLSGKYNQVFSAKPQLFNQQLAQIYSDPASGLDANTRDRIGQVLKVRQATEYREAQTAKNVDAFNGTKQELFNQSYLSDAVRVLGATPEDAANRIEMVPHGKFLDQGGYVIPDVKTGGRTLNPKFSNESAKGSWDVIDKNTGQVIDGTGSVNDSAKKVWDNYHLRKGMVDGSYLQKDIQTIQTPAAPVKKQDVQVPGFGHKQSTSAAQGSTFTTDEFGFKKSTTLTPLAPESPLSHISEGLASHLSVAPQVIEEHAGEELSALKSQMQTYIDKPETRGSVVFQMQRADTVKNIARAVTNQQFKDTPVIQARFTQSHIEEYNKALLADYTKKGLANADDLYEAQKVTTPEDLYYVNKAPVVIGSINKYIDGVLSSANRKKTQVGNSQITANQVSSYAAGIANGG